MRIFKSNKTVKRLIAFLLWCSPLLAQTVATPTFSQPTGTYTNSVMVTIQNTTSGSINCWTVDGTTPTATTAGICDPNGHIFASISYDASFATFSSTGTLQAISTKSGSTNSPVASATYTITSLAATNPIGHNTPVNVTNATTNIVNQIPTLLQAPNGNIFLFYGQSTNGQSQDNAAPTRAMFLLSTNGGSSWSSPTSVSCQSGDPATGCFYNSSNTTYGNLVDGVGVTPAGTLLAFLNTWVLPGFTPGGVTVARSTNNGSSWTFTALVTPSNPSPNNFENPTNNLVAIPSGSPGVTGSCASGCVMMDVRQGSSTYGKLFSYDDGVTWSDPVNIPQTWPYIDEERGTVWLGGMNLISFNRPEDDTGETGVEAIWPTALMVLYSSNLGTTWNSYTFNGSSTAHGIPSNLPLTSCAYTPSTEWVDVWTRPSVAIDPNNSNLATLLYGERYSCTATSSTTLYQWQVVTFNAASAFANAGQNLPLPQTLQLNSITTAQPHSTYSTLIANGNQLLMAYEQGNTTTTEDIYTVVLDYLSAGPVVNGGKWNGGAKVQ
jgi:hypothetical protein